MLLDHIAPLDALEKECIEIDSFLNITCSENPADCVNRGLDLMVHLARTGKMLADAKYWQDEAVKTSIIAELKLECSPSILKKLIEATCKRENFIVNWIDRLNSSCVHQMDFLRTIISKAKAEMQNFHE